jgi:uncharacterized DUF497 family protein
VAEWLDERFDCGEERWIAVGLLEGKEVVVVFRAQGKGYQTRINAVLRTYVKAQLAKRGVHI